jgi:tetratricopeptide (TPR) repeat protein
LKAIYGAQAKPDSAQITYDIGVRNLTKATKAWPEIVLYHQFLGIVHYANENKDEAIKCYKTAIELDPSNNISFRFLLQLYTMNDQQDKGSQLIDWWLSHHPDDREALQMKNMYRRMPTRG